MTTNRHAIIYDATYAHNGQDFHGAQMSAVFTGTAAEADAWMRNTAATIAAVEAGEAPGYMQHRNYRNFRLHSWHQPEGDPLAGMNVDPLGRILAENGGRW